MAGATEERKRRFKVKHGAYSGKWYTEATTPLKGRLVRHSMLEDHGIGIIKAELHESDTGRKCGFIVSFPKVGDVAVHVAHLLWVGGPPDQPTEKASDGL